MARDIVISFDLDNLEGSKEKLELLDIEFQKAVQDGLEEFSVRFRKKLIENMVIYGLPSGQLITMINIYQNGNELIVATNNEKIAYIEYGVGLVGSENPHPRWMDWRYDVNAHGEKGWVYYATDAVDFSFDDYYFQSNSGNSLAWTKGHEARPFIYKTWLWGTRSIYQIVMKHIRRIKID